MAEILIKAIDHTHPDPEKDRRGAYKRGYPVEVRPDGAAYGSEECPPKFVVLKVPGVSVDAVRHFMSQWEKRISYSIVSQNAAQGRYQVRVTGQNVSVSGQNALTREQVETFLARWGAVVDSVASNEVVFTVSLWDMVRSEGFWRVNPALALFTLVSYSGTTGIGTIDCDYHLISSFQPEQAERLIQERGGIVVSHQGFVVRFTVERSVLLAAFQASVRRSVETTYCRRQYYFAAAIVDQALAAGGVLSVSASEALAAIRNKLDE